jgi:hypothetical protein
MISRSKIKKSLFAGLAAAVIGACAWTIPAEAGGPYGGWRGGYGWSGVHDRQAYWPRPFVHRTVVVERPLVVRRPLIRRTVIVERPIVRRPVFVDRTVVVEPPVYVRRVVRRPAYWREARFIERTWRGPRWRERPRCFLPERYLCR